jgi:hypothetical protein
VEFIGPALKGHTVDIRRVSYLAPEVFQGFFGYIRKLP